MLVKKMFHLNTCIQLMFGSFKTVNLKSVKKIAVIGCNSVQGFLFIKELIATRNECMSPVETGAVVAPLVFVSQNSTKFRSVSSISAQGVFVWSKQLTYYILLPAWGSP